MMIDHWKIRINGYGSFDFHGTEKEAEKMRAHKAKYEGGCGYKWRTKDQRPSDTIMAAIAELFDARKGVPMKMFDDYKSTLKKESIANGVK